MGSKTSARTSGWLGVGCTNAASKFRRRSADGGTGAKSTPAKQQAYCALAVFGSASNVSGGNSREPEAATQLS
jgi:hypothetical protein